jgi:signal transduction histidine kinase
VMDLKGVLARLAEGAALMLRADAAVVCLLDEGSTRLSVAAIYGLPAELLSRAPFELESSILDREALAGHPVLVEDVQHDPRIAHTLCADLQGFRSALCIPLVNESRPVGTLHVYATASARFGEDDAARIEPLAGMGVAALVAMREAAELEALEANRAQFLRVTTHELRSPVTVAQSLVRSVLKRYTGELTDQQADILTRISRRLDLLESLINDLLDLAAGKSPETVDEKPIVLNASIGRVMLLLQPRAEDKGIHLALRPCHDQLIVRGTEEGLDRIFVNLVGNAVKYTPQGGAVTVAMQQIEGQAQVEVSDTGIGILEEALPHLFEEFYRAPNAKKSAEIGTGLGLAIVKDLVDRYDGRIQVKSAVGSGTTFTVTFPLVSDRA